jgi:hypothetical protein
MASEPLKAFAVELQESSRDFRIERVILAFVIEICSDVLISASFARRPIMPDVYRALVFDARQFRTCWQWVCFQP